jgi:hypothetical protein
VPQNNNKRPNRAELKESIIHKTRIIRAILTIYIHQILIVLKPIKTKKRAKEQYRQRKEGGFYGIGRRYLSKALKYKKALQWNGNKTYKTRIIQVIQAIRIVRIIRL